ncbi:MAG: type II secretion system GspH family protein [Candidatus Berkelbacteria bacterium]|nr:type II secretion system GspH family protein [Candidatus Berkelbacteria bacterium]
MKKGGFSVLELIIVIFIVSLFGGLVSSTIIKSYSNNKLVETQSVVQTELNLAIDRLSRVLRSSTLIMEATETIFKIRGYPNVADNAPSEIKFYLDGTALRYSVIPPTGQAPDYTYNEADAKVYTLVGKTTNAVNNPAFRYYNDQNVLLNFPVSVSSIKIVEPTLSAIDSGNILKSPIIVTTKITLRNFKTNL